MPGLVPKGWAGSWEQQLQDGGLTLRRGSLAGRAWGVLPVPAGSSTAQMLTGSHEPPSTLARI